MTIDIRKLETLPGSVKPAIEPPATRLEASPHAHPSAPPPYSSLISDVFRDICIHKYKDKLRQIALHQVKLKAGQNALPSGGFGREFRPPALPEMRGGKILSGNV